MRDQSGFAGMMACGAAIAIELANGIALASRRHRRGRAQRSLGANRRGDRQREARPCSALSQRLVVCGMKPRRWEPIEIRLAANRLTIRITIQAYLRTRYIPYLATSVRHAAARGGDIARHHRLYAAPASSPSRATACKRSPGGGLAGAVDRRKRRHWRRRHREVFEQRHVSGRFVVTMQPARRRRDLSGRSLRVEPARVFTARGRVVVQKMLLITSSRMRRASRRAGAKHAARSVRRWGWHRRDGGSAAAGDRTNPVRAGEIALVSQVPSRSNSTAARSARGSPSRRKVAMYLIDVSAQTVGRSEGCSLPIRSSSSRPHAVQAASVG